MTPAGPLKVGRASFHAESSVHPRKRKEALRMAIIRQRRLFSWREVEDLQDLERLRLVIEHMPDEELMRLLEEERGCGRDDHPVRGMWNSLLAGVVFGHESIESLRRELARNAQLREMCGLERVPSAAAYTRFLKRLVSKQAELEAMFDRLVSGLSGELEGFGEVLAIDSKGVRSHGRPSRRDDGRAPGPDGRRDTDADFGVKTYRGRQRDGTLWQRVKRWFGYKLHLVVDAEYELPVAFEVTRGSASDLTCGFKLLEKLHRNHPEIIDRCEVMTGDRAYDSKGFLSKLWDDYDIKPVVDIRDLWRDGEETRLLSGRDNVVYDFCGNVFCYCPRTGERRQMAYGGFEKDRGTLKYRCPARHYGVVRCCGESLCKAAGGVRIPLSEDRRVFTPVARSSHRWKRLYKKRTAVERVNAGWMSLSALSVTTSAGWRR